MSLARRYLRILAPARGPIAGYLVSGISLSLKPLAAVFLLREAGRGYDIVGLVLAAELFGAALSLPVQGRLVDRLGPRVVLTVLAILHVELLLAFTGAVRAGWADWTLIATTFGWGATSPALLPTLRSLWGRLYGDRDEDRDTAYALQAVISEFVFLAGPLVASGLAVAVSTTAAMVGAAVLSLGGVSLFALTVRLPARAPIAPQATGRRWAMRSRKLWVLTMVAAFGGVAGGSLEILLPAFAEASGSTERAGIGFALLAAGSIVGGLVYGARSWRSPLARRYALFNALLALCFAPLVLRPDFVVVCAVLFVAGLTISPGEACLYGLVDDLADPSQIVEVNSWVMSLFTVGVGVGTIVGGTLVHHADLVAAAFVPAIAAALAGVLVFAGVRGPATEAEDRPVLLQTSPAP